MRREAAVRASPGGSGRPRRGTVGVHGAAAAREMSRRAVIIDDDADARALAATVLRDAMPGIRLTEVSDAIALADALGQPELDIAIVARELQWSDSAELIKLIHRRHVACATVLLGTPPADQSDPDTQPDVHLSRSFAGLARLGRAALSAVEKRARERHAAAQGGALGRLPVAILELDGEERVLSANPHALTLLGHDADAQVIGRPLGELLAPGGDTNERDGAVSLARAAAASPEGVSAHARRAADPATTYRMLARTDSPRGVIEGFTVALVPDTLASGGRIDNLVYAVSHDLQQPLATTGRSAQMLADRLQARGRLDTQEERMLRRIVSGAQRMETLMRDLLDYVKTGQNPLIRERVDLGRVCEDVVSRLQTQLEDTGGVVRFGDLPVISVSRGEIIRLMENLVGNALKFRGEENPVVEIDCVQRDDSWLLSVRDNGIGLDPKDAERVFQPFQRLHTESEYPGTGIGLAICQQICERHGGHMWVTPNPRRGSTFFATFAREVEE